MSTFGDTLAGIEEHNHREQLKDTWGHLAPAKNKKYNGRIVYAVGCLGSDNINPVIIAFDFGELSSSPWLYEALHEFIGDGERPITQEHPYGGYDGFCYMKGGLKNEPGCVYEWTGTVRNYVFRGVRKTLLDSNK